MEGAQGAAGASLQLHEGAGPCSAAASAGKDAGIPGCGGGFGFLPGSSKASSSAAQPAERDLSWQQHQQQQWDVALQDMLAAAAGAAA
jgi:hypothetical protein